MEQVSPEKIQEINQAALNATATGIEELIRQLMKEKNLSASQVEIVQEASPSGIRIFVRERQPTKEGETRDN